MNKIKTTFFSIYLLMILIVLQGLSGIFGGIGLVLDPSGKFLQIPIQWLADSPFSDYFIPGIILLVVLGICPIVVAVGLYRKRAWSWFGALFIGIVLLIWIGVEILIIGYQPKPPLQLIYGLLGVAVLAMVFLPSIRRIYLNKKST